MLRLPDPAAVTRHVVNTTLRAKRLSARYAPTPADVETERATLLEQLTPMTRVEITSDAFIGTLDAMVIETTDSRIDLVDRDSLGHSIVLTKAGWRLRRYDCVDVRFELEILCDVAATERSPEDDYAMILADAIDDDDLRDRLSSHAFEIAKKATGLLFAGKVSGDVDESLLEAAVVLYVGKERLHVLVNLVTADSYVALTGGV